MSDEGELGRLGYAQELIRRMGGFSSFAVSFSIISVLTGCITAYSDAIFAGGPIAIGLGWPLVSLGTLLVALAMSELASAFPTAGALYHWSALLGGAGAGWFTAAINIVGQLAIVAAIDLGCANELAPIATPILGPTLGGPLGLLVLILASHAVINIFGVRLVAWLNDFSATVHIVGVVVIVGALFLFGRVHPAGFFFAAKLGTDGPPPSGLGIANGLVLSMFTFTGYDASAHLAEETHDPARRTPWGILASVLVSAIFGYLLLFALTLAISSDGAPLTAMTNALGSGFGRAAMGLALAAMWFCGLSSVTSASRTVYAFARDGGLPASALLARVPAGLRTPVPALLVVTVVPLLLVLCIHAASTSTEPFDVMAKVATMGLYVSYAIPIALGANARRAGRWKRPGPFHLRGHGVFVAWVAVAWCAFVLVVCSLPPNFLAGALLGGLIVVLAVVFFVFVRRRFKGPKVDLAMLER